MQAADPGGSLGRAGGNTVKTLKHLNRANISVALNNIQVLFTNIILGGTAFQVAGWGDKSVSIYM